MKRIKIRSQQGVCAGQVMGYFHVGSLERSFGTEGDFAEHSDREILFEFQKFGLKCFVYRDPR